MRNKDFTFYWNTALLRLESLRFQRIQSLESYQNLVKSKQVEYKKLANQIYHDIMEETSYFFTYAHFDFSDNPYGPDMVFKNAYRWKNSFPVSLKNSIHDSPLLPFYYGLLWWNHEIENKESSKDRFRSIADYMILEAVEKNDSLYFQYHYDYDVFNLKSGWIAGITQALACSFFCRVYQLTNDTKYKDAAKKSFNPMLVPVESGGLLTATSAGLEWVEEYPSDPKSHVLNGHIFTIFAAHDLNKISEDEHYNIYKKSWLNSLTHHLVEYQSKHYVLHNKYQSKLGNIEYQGLNVSQFLHLARITGSRLYIEFFLFYYEHMDWKRFYKFYGIKHNTNSAPVHKEYQRIMESIASI